MILSCIVTHNRLAYSVRAVETYLATAGKSAHLVVVDNASTDGTLEWLQRRASEGEFDVLANDANLYPGAACNRGWDHLLAKYPGASLLHRGDNDVTYRRGWRSEVERQFAANPRLALLGVLNLHEDGVPPGDGIEVVPRVGGNVVMPARLFLGGLRWDERQWSRGVDEDGPMSWAAHRHGVVARLRRTVADNIAFGRYADYPEYYDRTASLRGYDPESSV